MPCCISSHKLQRKMAHRVFKCCIWKHSVINQVSRRTFCSRRIGIFCHMKSGKNSELTATYIFTAHFDIHYNKGKNQQYHPHSSQNHIRSPMCYEWKNSPVKFHKALSVNLIVTSTQAVCTLDFTMDRSLRIYCGCDPRRDVSLVEIFAADKENKLCNRPFKEAFINFTVRNVHFKIYIPSYWLSFLLQFKTM